MIDADFLRPERLRPSSQQRQWWKSALQAQSLLFEAQGQAQTLLGPRTERSAHGQRH